jgi:hypothetical protein
MGKSKNKNQKSSNALSRLKSSEHRCRSSSRGSSVSRISQVGSITCNTSASNLRSNYHILKKRI